jgi:hypothetical protein
MASDKISPTRITSMNQAMTGWFAYLEERSARILAALFSLSIAVFLIAIPLPRVDGMLIGSDGVGYYMYVRSAVIDHDIDFANEYKHLYPADHTNGLRTSTGLMANKYAIGTAILWLPFFLVGHLISCIIRSAGFSVSADGYSYIYQAAVCIGSILYGYGGMVLMHRTTRRLFANTALAACVLLWLATNFIYYLIVEPSMSHMCSFFAASLLMYIWLRVRPIESLRQCFTIGLAGGLVGLVRQPDATLFLLPLLDSMFTHKSFLERGKRLAVTVAGFFSIFWMQMFVWNILNGSPFLSGYFLNNKEGFSWWSPHLFDVLFSTEHGLFLWHPLLLFASVGLVLLLPANRFIGGLLLAGFFGQVYLIASWSSWSQGDSFGGRMFISSLPIFAVGLAAFLQRVTRKNNMQILSLAVCGALVLWNFFFLIQYRLGFISMSGPYTLRELTIGKMEMILEIANRFLR